MKNTPLKYKELEKLVRDFLMTNNKKNYSYKMIIKRLHVKDKKTKRAVKSILKALNKEKYKTTKKTTRSDKGKTVTITGKVDYVNPRFAFIQTDELEEDVYVKAENLKYALDDDTVRVVLLPKTRKGSRIEGRVVEIIKRYRDTFVGRVEIAQHYAFVVPDFKKMHYDIFIPLSGLNKAKKDDKVLVKITKWPSHDKNPEGEVIRILGASGENDAEIHSIMAEFGLPFEFPENVLEASEKISREITDREIEGRRDFRDVITFTIDPEDAKDFDDALSFRKLDNNRFEIGIHIADVTHYVNDDSVLDEEAFDRGTSVYLVDRTIPMLPERLSNDLCSLRPNEDKLTFSAVFQLDKQARIIKEWFGKTIIHSDRRFSYEEAQERIEQLEGDFSKELVQLNELALKLRVERFMRGAINFETTEVKFELDENGRAIGLIPKERKDAHRMIEEFMLLANKRVAEFVYNMRKGKVKNTFVYRIHDYPDPEKLQAFSVFAKKFGHELEVSEGAISKSLNNLIEDIEGRPEQNVLQTLAIRSMAKARYTTEPRGHFGLAFRHYTHFTSPIRRFPDMMVHRLLFHYLNHGNPVEKEKYEKMCEHASDMEKLASDSERASIKYKQAEYMQTMIGETFDGIVSGVTDWGIYVEITKTNCEGMVRLSDIKGDYFVFDEDNYQVIGNNTGRTIMLGDDVKVRVLRTDINRRTIDLELVQ